MLLRTSSELIRFHRQIKSKTGRHWSSLALSSNYYLRIAMSFQYAILAIKYSRKEVKSYVDIKIGADSNYLIIRIEDNGEGISEKHLPRIFDMFYRANDKAQGSGLGLHILKRAVERLNGIMDVESTVNVGSVFIVKLPLNR